MIISSGPSNGAIFRTERSDGGGLMAIPIVTQHGTPSRPIPKSPIIPTPTFIAGVPKIMIPMIPPIPLRPIMPSGFMTIPLVTQHGLPSNHITTVHSKLGTFTGKSGVQDVSKNPSAMALKRFFNIAISPRSLNSSNVTLGLKPIQQVASVPITYINNFKVRHTAAVNMPLIPFSNFEQYGNVPSPIVYPLNVHNYIPVAPATAETAFDSRPIFGMVSRFQSL